MASQLPPGFVLDQPRPAAAPTIQGPPRLPAPQTPAQAQHDVNVAGRDAVETQHLQLENQNLQRQNELRSQATTNQADEARNVLRAIDQARSNTGWWSTGMRGQALSGLGGTEAHDLSSNIDTITANIGFDRLQQMRNASPTGGALGQVSDFENRMLQSSLTSLRQSQTEEQFRQNLDAVELHYLNVIGLLGGQAPARDLNEARTRINPPHPLGPAVHGSGIVGQAGPPPGTPPGSRPDHSGEDVVFGFEGHRPEPPQGPTPAPGGAEFSAALQAAIQSGRFRSTDEAMAYARQLNPDLASRIDRVSLNAAIRGDHSRARVAIPLNPPPAGPDISSLRGTQDAQARAFAENQTTSGLPIVGPAVQTVQQFSGPESGNAFLHGGEDWVSLGGRDEATAGIDSLMGRGSYADNVAVQRAMDRFDEQNHFGARTGGQLAAGLPEAFLPGGMAAQMARGGAQGFAYGFGSGEGSPAQRIPNALVSGAVGAFAPPVLAAGGRAVGAGVRAAGRGVNALRATVTPEGTALAEAAAQEHVPISRPIVDPTARDRMAYLDASRGSGNTVREGLDATRAGIENRAGQLGQGGTAEDAGTMGLRIQGAGQRFVQRSRGVRDQLYSRAAQLAGNRTVLARDAVAEIDRQIQELSGNPTSNQGEISFLNGLRSDLADANGNLIPKTVAQIRDLRTSLRGRIGQTGMTFSQVEGRVLQVLGQARNDIARDLSSSAPAAVRAYARADQFNAQRADEIQQVIRQVTGPRNAPLSGEQVWAKMRAMAGPRGNSEGMSRLWTKLDPAERMDAAATLAEHAGRMSPEEDFSPSQFMRFARSLSPSARQTIFGPEGARSIANLRALSVALVQTTKRLNNSRSGMVSNWRETAGRWREMLGSLIGAGGSYAAGGGTAATVVAGAAGAAGGMAARGVGNLTRRLSARALMSPDMSRWLRAGASVSSPSALRSHIGRLSEVAARDPAIAQEVLGLRQFLLRAANDNVEGRLAASPPDQQQQNTQGQ